MALDPSAVSLQGRVAVVTGGGAGIGRGIAAGLVAFGARVAIWERDEATCVAAATEIGGLALVTDVRGLPKMAETGWPVVFDATHSVQQPGGLGGSSGGQREYVPVLARAACAVGVSGLFIETHQDPDNAPSDGPNMVPVDQLKDLVGRLRAFDALAKGL